MAFYSSPLPMQAPGSIWLKRSNASSNGRRYRGILSMMWKFSKTGFARRLQAGTGIPHRSSGKANAMLAEIGPTLVGIDLADREPQLITCSRSAFVLFATTGESPNAAELGN